MEGGVFDALAGSLRFDTKRFAKDIKTFRVESGREVSTSGSALAEGQRNGSHEQQQPQQLRRHVDGGGGSQQQQEYQKPGKKKKKTRRKRQENDGSAESKAKVDGISVFGAAEATDDDGGGAEANPFRDAPTEPVVRTGDPEEEANVIRKRHRIKVSGALPPAPLRGFGDLAVRFRCPPTLLRALADDGYREPTPIQRQAIPALLRGRELLAIAPTGSGKTLAFLLPMVLYACGCVPLKEGSGGNGGTAGSDGNREGSSGSDEEARDDNAGGDGNDSDNAGGGGDGGVKSLVVSPTRELSAQTFRLLTRLTSGGGLLQRGGCLRCCLLTKPAARGTDFSKVDVLAATPRLAERLVKSGRLQLSSLRCLVLDEADRLFEMGFLGQVDTLLAAATGPHLVRALFSATLPERVEELARGVLRQPLRVTVGERNTAQSSVTQRLLFVGQERGKLLALRQMIADGLTPPVLVFASSKERAQQVHRELLYEGVRVDSIHSDQLPSQREAAVDNFRSGRTWVLVATDLVGRGMDFLGVSTVVNYDFPRSTTDYIHRVGRTGRGGSRGEAVTLFTEDDKAHVRAVANVMKAAGAELPDWVLSLKKERKKRKRTKGPDLVEEEEEGGQDGGGGGMRSNGVPATATAAPAGRAALAGQRQAKGLKEGQQPQKQGKARGKAGGPDARAAPSAKAAVRAPKPKRKPAAI